MEQFEYLDVSLYEAPVPLIMVLEAIQKLDANKKLIVIHRIEPTRLFPMISEKYNYTVHKKNEMFEITIWIKDAQH